MLDIPVIRLATSDDAKAIAALARDCIEQGLGWSYTPERTLRAMRCRSTNVAVIHEHGALLAAGIMGYGDTTAHLVLLGVQPTRRRRGWGRQLLSWLEACAVTAGLDKIGVEARADNHGAIAFYLGQGYAVRGRVPGYYRHVIDAVCLEKRLGIASRVGRI